MIYHFTDRQTAADIHAHRVIQAKPFILPDGTETDPIIWLTTARTPVLGRSDDVCWFGLRNEFPTLGVWDYIVRAGTDADLWRRAIGGWEVSCWRVCLRDIPLSEVAAFGSLDDAI